jgi:hypothetical protein
MNFSVCNIESQNNYPDEQTELIKFDSLPQGGDVFVNNYYVWKIFKFSEKI